MEEKVVKVYKFHELSDTGKEKALEELNDINVDYDWYDYSYEYFIQKLEEVGLTCDSFYFSLGRDYYLQPVNLKIIDEKLYLKACNIDLRTKEARLILEETGFCVSTGKYNTTIETDDKDYSEVIQDKLSDFLQSLKKDYEYLTTEESIIETIECNDYDFTSNGKLF